MLAQISNVDGIVAVGGGSVIDTAKAISVIMTNPEHGSVVSLDGAVETRNKAHYEEMVAALKANGYTI